MKGTGEGGFSRSGFGGAEAWSGIEGSCVWVEYTAERFGGI